MNTATLRSLPLVRIAVAASVLAVCGCQEDARSAQWYMAHGDELKAKLEECRKYTSLNQSDPNCKSANDAFSTLVTASADKNATAPPQPVQEP